MQPLARVIDEVDLEAAPGPRGQLAIDVLPPWVAEGATVEVVVPGLVACARCEGGGCDGCGRSGALRLALDERGRTFRLALPRTSAARVGLRLVRPLGADAGLDQLVLVIRAAAEASCRRLDAPLARRSAWPWLLALAAALLALAAALLRR